MSRTRDKRSETSSRGPCLVSLGVRGEIAPGVPRDEGAAVRLGLDLVVARNAGKGHFAPEFLREAERG
jgi:hypothetical protein